MSDNQFEINGTWYQVSKINPWKQFHVARKLAPLIGQLIPALVKFKNFNMDQISDEQTKALEPLFKSFADLPTADADMIMKTLLSCIAMKQESGNYAQLVVNEQIMFANMDLPTMLQCAGRAFQYNLAGFFAGHLSTSKNGG